MYAFAFCHLLISLLLAVLAIKAHENSNLQKAEVTQVYEKYTNLFPQIGELPRCGRCGQALTSEIGGIYYKPFEAILPNERCSWIIGVKGAVGYRVNIQHLGFNQSSSSHGLVLTGVRHGPVLTNYIPNSPGYLDIRNANILVVTFYSSLLDDDMSTGFAMQYESIQVGDISKTANESSHHVFQYMTFDFKHPSTGLTYADNELSSFLFPPNGNIYSGENFNVHYVRGELDGCLDAVYIYALNVSSTFEDIWESKGRICDDDLTAEITNDDTILILFQSDASTVHSGFNLTYETCKKLNLYENFD